MHLSTNLDCDLVAVETADELTLLVEITAPTPATKTARPTATLQIVLDRSGSMGGNRLEGAKTALLALIDRLEPTDNVGVVAFDNTVQVVIPAGPLSDKARAKAAVAALEAGGSTDLSAGYLRGLQEAQRVCGQTGATVLIISDGHANAGVTDPATLGKIAVEAVSGRITTSTLGFGLGYDELLLSALAQGGQGNELFAEEADTATALIGGEVDGLLTQVGQAASLKVSVSSDVKNVALLNDLPCVGLDDGVMIELGSFYAGETRRLVLTLGIPAIAARGLAEVATLELTHVSLPDLVQHRATLPIHVNVVPGDQAAGRIPNPVVVSEALFQQTQRSKKEASRRLTRGDVAGASAILQASSAHLREVSLSIPAPLAAELTGEADVMSALAEEATFDVGRAAKSSASDYSRKSRQRGRATRSGLVLRLADVTTDEPTARVTLEEWELTRLERQAPPAGLLVGFLGDVAPASLCQQILERLEVGSVLWTFFSRGTQHGGVIVERA